MSETPKWRRESAKMLEADWRRLDELAAATGSTYRGRPSWRAMLRRIARGEIKCENQCSNPS